jgi:hypothetical protein
METILRTIKTGVLAPLLRLPIFGWIRGTDQFLILGRLRD